MRRLHRLSETRPHGEPSARRGEQQDTAATQQTTRTAVGRRTRRPRFRGKALPSLLVLLTSGAALAHRSTTAHRSRGTHFLAEGNLGITLGDAGLALSGVLGVGGKLRGLWPRFYLIGEVGHQDTRGRQPPDRTASPTYRHTDLAAGLRVYFPLPLRLRPFGEFLVGQSHLRWTSEPGERNAIWHATLASAAGIQLRLSRHLSLGARFRFLLTAPPDQATEAKRRFSLTAGLAWHF